MEHTKKNFYSHRLFFPIIIAIILIATVAVTVLRVVKKETQQEQLLVNNNLVSPRFTTSENNNQLSPKRNNAPQEMRYETKPNGERCAIIDLNDYIPTKNKETQTYEWIIEFPADQCVIQNPASNLPEQLGVASSENIPKTNFRRIIISYLNSNVVK